MQNRILKTVWMGVLLISGLNSWADTTSGKITEVQLAIDHDNVYFKLDSMPADASRWFFISPQNSGAYHNCSYQGGPEHFKRVYAALLAAKASSKSITIGYCKATDGYGLVNQFFRVNR